MPLCHFAAVPLCRCAANRRCATVPLCCCAVVPLCQREQLIAAVPLCRCINGNSSGRFAAVAHSKAAAAQPLVIGFDKSDSIVSNSIAS